jgi:hypothetical protein
MIHPLALLDEVLDDDLEDDIVDFLARCEVCYPSDLTHYLSSCTL